MGKWPELWNTFICQILLNGSEYFYFYYQTRVSQSGLGPCMGPAPSPELLCVFCDSFPPLFPPQTGSLNENLRFLNSLVPSTGNLEEQSYSVPWGISVQKYGLKMAAKKQWGPKTLKPFFLLLQRKTPHKIFFPTGNCCKKLQQVRVGHAGHSTAMTPLPSIPSHPFPVPADFMPCHTVLPCLIPSPVSQCWPPHSLLEIIFYGQSRDSCMERDSSHTDRKSFDLNFYNDHWERGL